MLNMRNRSKAMSLDDKLLHDLRNHGMKLFGQLFMQYVGEDKMDADAANLKALVETSALMLEVAAEFQKKTEYTKE